MVHSGDGKIMYWGCFQGQQQGVTIEVLPEMNGKDYLQMLQNNLDVQILVIYFNKITVCRIVPDWFLHEGIDVMVWSPQSPNVNSIENVVWSHITASLDKDRITSMLFLRIRVQDIWNNLEHNYLNDLKR